jgi:hypothetical protein
MNLFIDDLRACPKGWYVARTITDAIRFLHQYRFDVVSLDHDIMMMDCPHNCHGLREETFEPVAWHLSLMVPRPEVMIHTSNYSAGERMARILGIAYLPMVYDASEYDRLGGG